MLRKYPNHGFEDIAQLNIFHNGLRYDTKMLQIIKPNMIDKLFRRNGCWSLILEM